MPTNATTKQNTWVILGMAVVLIWGFVTAVTIPAGEYPPSGYAIFTMVLDAAMTLILTVLLVAESRNTGSGLRAVAMVVGPLGVLAGAAQVIIRFTSDHGWWTGHYFPPVFN
jgi:hypothetical protein